MAAASPLARVLDDLERERLAGLTAAGIVLFGVCFPAAVLGVAALYANYGKLGLGAFLVSAVAFFVRKSILRNAARSLKQRIIPGLVAEIDPQLEYSASGMSRDEFRSYGLFRDPDRYASQDLVTGIAGKTAIRFAMVHAERATGRKRDWPTHADLFKGLLFIAQFNKRLRATTRVATGEADFLDELSSKHVELEDPRFNELYNVTSTDQVEARYVLTPRMMERFVALEIRFKAVSATFFDDKVVLALEADYDLFDPHVGARIDAAQLRSLLARLKNILGIVEELDLNTRIWTAKGLNPQAEAPPETKAPPPEPEPPSPQTPLPDLFSPGRLQDDPLAPRSLFYGTLMVIAGVVSLGVGLVAAYWTLLAFRAMGAGQLGFGGLVFLLLVPIVGAVGMAGYAVLISVPAKLAVERRAPGTLLLFLAINAIALAFIIIGLVIPMRSP